MKNLNKKYFDNRINVVDLFLRSGLTMEEYLSKAYEGSGVSMIKFKKYIQYHQQKVK